jgi:hypothetical protein
MRIVAKMKVIMSPPGRILKEQPRGARAPVQPAQLNPDREELHVGPKSHMAQGEEPGL